VPPPGELSAAVDGGWLAHDEASGFQPREDTAQEAGVHAEGDAQVADLARPLELVQHPSVGQGVRRTEQVVAR